MPEACCNDCSKGKTCQSLKFSESDFKHQHQHSGPFETHELNDLLGALVNPSKYRSFRFPSSFRIPSYCFQQRNSYILTTNSSGNVLFQMAMGQYLDAGNFKSGASGSQNGSSTVGNSTTFMCNDSTLTGSAAVAGTAFTALQVNAVPSGVFTSIRAGPMSIEVDYIGRLDIAAGYSLMGMSYTTVSDPTGVAVSTPALYPDVSYSSSVALEDAAYAKKTSNVTESMKAIFIPHDSTLLNFKSPVDTTSTPVTQRLTYMLLSGPPSQQVARVTVTQNWEAQISKNYADIMTPTLDPFGPVDPTKIFDYVLANSMVIV